MIDKIKFINSYSFIFSPRPGTTAANLSEIDSKTTKERLIKVQEKLFFHQKNKNKSYEGNIIDVLVENEMDDKKKLFGRNENMSSVIFEGNKNLIGKVVQVKINSSNQNSLFGELNLKKIEAA